MLWYFGTFPITGKPKISSISLADTKAFFCFSNNKLSKIPKINPPPAPAINIFLRSGGSPIGLPSASRGICGLEMSCQGSSWADSTFKVSR